MRLRRNLEAEIAVPVFDRDLEIARAGARLIAQSVPHILCRGQLPAARSSPRGRACMRCSTPRSCWAVRETVLQRRLVARWQGYRLTEEQIAEKVDGNDIPNGRMVIAGSGRPNSS